MTFYRSQLVLTVLSDRPLDELEVGQVMHECDEGDMVLASVGLRTSVISREVMDRALVAAGSDAEFFPAEEP